MRAGGRFDSGKAIFDRDVLTLDKAFVFQTLTERCQELRGFGGLSCAKKPNDRHRWLLRSRRQRPRCRSTAEKRDELASLHVPSARDHALCNGYSLALCDQAASEKWHTTDRLFLHGRDVRFGS